MAHSKYCTCSLHAALIPYICMCAASTALMGCIHYYSLHNTRTLGSGRESERFSALRAQTQGASTKTPSHSSPTWKCRSLAPPRLGPALPGLRPAWAPQWGRDSVEAVLPAGHPSVPHRVNPIACACTPPPRRRHAEPRQQAGASDAASARRRP